MAIWYSVLPYSFCLLLSWANGDKRRKQTAAVTSLPSTSGSTLLFFSLEIERESERKKEKETITFCVFVCCSASCLVTQFYPAKPPNIFLSIRLLSLTCASALHQLSRRHNAKQRKTRRKRETRTRQHFRSSLATFCSNFKSL